MPDQAGRIAVVTGATSGLGLWCARGLAARGAEVVLAVRNTEKGEATANKIRAQYPMAKLSVRELDLASLASVWNFAVRVSDTLPRIDLLLNNAGLGLQPQRIATEDGFEQQFGVNFLGHFALTARMVPTLLRAPAPRVVTVASMAHRRGRILWADPNQTNNYSGRAAYNQSKLACLMFALELAARATEQHSRLASLAAHPGLALTGFIAATLMPGFMQTTGLLATRLIGQSAEAGSWPLLYAATMPDAANGDYWGPDGFKEIRGNPARATVWPHASHRADWQRLWTMAEKMTGLTYPSLA
jgi:NAD(P)-dependent dehydrogenase (short-subunit alcohol dehydrogenase family)